MTFLSSLFSRHRWAVLALVVAAIVPEMAWAGPFAVPEGDMSKKVIMDYLFGPLIDGGASPLTALMQVFNGAMLLIGGILVGYTIIAGTMSTAHDGEMLGQKWSSLWIPIRTSLGTAAILPVVGGGWCVAQAIVVWLGMQGIGMADKLWETFATSNSVLTAAVYMPPESSQAVRATYASMLISNTCVAAGVLEESEVSGEDAALLGMDKSVIKPVANGLGWTYGKQAVEGSLGLGPVGMAASGISYKPVCGSAVIDTSQEVGNDSGTNWGSGDIMPATGGRLLDMSAINKAVANVRNQQFIAAQNRLAPLGARIAAGTATQEEVDEALKSIAENYSKAVSEAALSAYDSAVQKDFQKAMVADGWMMAGAWYMQMAKAQDQVSRSLSNMPVASFPIKTSAIDHGGEWYAPTISVGGSVSSTVAVAVDRATRMTKAANQKMVGGGVVAASESATDTEDGQWGAKLIGWFVNNNSAFGLQDGSAGQLGNAAQNPVMMAKGMGEKMTFSAWTALAAATISVVGTGGGVGGHAAFLAPTFTAIFMALLVPGAVLSTYVPMMPYILWLGVVIGWSVLMLEAVVAAPLWALVHLAPDGDGVVGRGGQGYMLVLSLVLRPPLMIIGLAAAFVLMKPLGQLVNSTFIGAFNMSVSPGYLGITQAIAGCIVYAVVMVTVIHRVFALIHVIPDRLLRWIGGGGNELGQEAGEMDRMAGAKLAGGMAAAQQLGGGVQGAMAQGMAAKRQQQEIKATRGGEAAQLAGNEQDRMYQDEVRMNASAATAAESSGPNSAAQMAVAGNADRMQRSAHRAAETSAKVDSSPEAKQFLGGLEAARASGNEKGYLQAQGQAAESAPNPRPFQEALIAGNRAGATAQQYRERAAQDQHSEATGPRQAREDMAPPSPPDFNA